MPHWRLGQRKGWSKLSWNIRQGFHCRDPRDTSRMVYLGQDREQALAKALALGIEVRDSDGGETPEDVDYGPGGCEAFAASAVRPGWICCACRHYTAWADGPGCHRCGTFRCPDLQRPPKGRARGWKNPGQFKGLPKAPQKV